MIKSQEAEANDNKNTWDSITHTMTLSLKASKKIPHKASEEKHAGNLCVSQIPPFGCVRNGAGHPALLLVLT